MDRQRPSKSRPVRAYVGSSPAQCTTLLFMSILTLTEQNFKDEVLQSNQPVLVDFYADWCGPCKALSPMLKEIANEVQGTTVGKVNIDEQPRLAVEYGISSIPTLLLFENGQVKNKVVGMTSKKSLKAIL